MNTEFTGAKMALYIGDRLAVILRDDIPGLPYRGQWDLPGGGREGRETPEACVRRECREELGLDVPETALIWRYSFVVEGQRRWFFVAQLPTEAAADVVFGNEGQRWMLMQETDFLKHPNGITFLQDRVRLWMKERSRRKGPPLA